jgi:membrane-bound lytic murein transglycosylase B
MTSDHRGRTVLLVVAAALLVGMVGAGVYAGSRPQPMLRIRPVEVVAEAPPSPADQPSSPAGHGASQVVVTVSPVWVRQTATAAGIPEPAVRAYGAATLQTQHDDPGCHLAWTTLAGIGWVESQQGTIDGRVLQANGRPDRAITGVNLDGSGDVAAVPDGSGGYQRALGPLQFIPSTWATWKADGDGDGVDDPQDVDDAALAAARYLCASGGDLATGSGWSAAIFSYNHSNDYVRAVYDAAKAYADRTS